MSAWKRKSQDDPTCAKGFFPLKDKIIKRMKFDHYTIRLLTVGDLEPYFEMVERNRKRLENFFTGTVSRTCTLQDTKEFLANITARAESRVYMPYVVTDDRNGKFIGFLDLKNIDWSIPKWVVT